MLRGRFRTIMGAVGTVRGSARSRASYDARMPPRRRSPILLLIALVGVVAALVLAGCSGDSEGDAPRPAPLPDGSTLLTDSAEAMRGVMTTRFSLEVAGEDTGLPVQAAEGQLDQEGSAEGTATVEQFGQLVELEFVLVGETLYVKGATGDYQELPASLAGTVYDPSVILDPDRGIAAVLASGMNPRTEAREAVAGVDAYRVRATFPGAALSEVVPGLEQDTEGQVWIAVEGNRMVQATFPVTGGSVTVALSDFDAPVDITAPA